MEKKITFYFVIVCANSSMFVIIMLCHTYPAYFMNFSPWLELHEQFSDECMSELIGGEGQPRCNPCKACMFAMFHRGQQEYSLTHQLLYGIEAEQV